MKLIRALERKIFFVKHVLFLLAILCLTAGAQATAVKAQHVTVDLVSEQRSVQPGAAFTLGLSFAIEQGWHLYWVNPGDAGLPPTVHWNLPDEITAREFQWPYPERVQLGSIVNYVYSGNLLLPINMQVGSLKGKTVSLSADVKWLVCSDVCIPGKATLSLELPVSSNAPQNDPTQKAAFAESRTHIPKPFTGSTHTIDANQEFIIKVDHLELRAPAQFFPLIPNQIDNTSAPRIVSMGKGMDIYLKKSDQLLKPVQQISGVLVLNDGRSFMVDSLLESNSNRHK